jgi:hypothetical protein
MPDASTKVSIGGSVAYITNGASMAAAAIVGTTINTALVGTGNLSSYPRCDLVMSGVSTSITTSSTSMNLFIYRRDINVGGGANNDEGAPGTSNKTKFVGVFSRPASASSSNFVMTAIDIPLPGGNSDCEFYIENGFTGSIENAGWALTVYPKTDVGATT